MPADRIADRKTNSQAKRYRHGEVASEGVDFEFASNGNALDGIEEFCKELEQSLGLPPPVRVQKMTLEEAAQDKSGGFISHRSP
jgi:hypothetical protein